MKKMWKKAIAVVCMSVMLCSNIVGTVSAQDLSDGTVADIVEESSLEDIEEENISLSPMEISPVSEEGAEEPAETEIEIKAETEVETESAIESAAIELFETSSESNLSVVYSAHMQSIGWQDEKSNGETAGTAGNSKRMEALKIMLSENSETAGSIEYRTHVSGLGWQNWTADGTVSGTTGQARALEAVQICLTGEISENYNVYYRVYSTGYGWLGWAKNGEIAGTTGIQVSMEAIEICLCPQNQDAPGTTDNHYIPGTWEISYDQIGETTVVEVKPEALAKIAQEKSATSLSITAKMEYNGQITRSLTAEKNIADLVSSGFEFDVKNYGKFTIEATFLKNGTVVGTNIQSFGVSASEYNIAPVSATLPVVVFSLSLWDINTDEEGNTIPTIVMLGRPSAYNWDELPSGVYGMPYLTEDMIKKTCDYNAFAAYVKDLYEINPNATFNLYLNDIDCDYIHQVIYANRIPEGQYTITLMSDGSATYSIFNETYAGSDPEAKHQELTGLWNSAKEYAYTAGTAQSGWSRHEHWECMYAVLSCEPGTRWWVARNNLFTSGDDNAFADKAAADVERKNISSMLTALENKGEDTVKAFKALYDFNDGYFEKAQAENKKAMMILGTYVYNENNFEDYARLTQLYYGDEYVYYYKGHPNTPTGMYTEKSEQLEKLDMDDIDSSIAAELILFFNPDINISGYGTSTFNSATPEMACGLYNTTKAAALATGNSVDYSGIDWFASSINKNTVDDSIAALCNGDGAFYMVEFSDEILDKGEFEFAIYDASRGILTFYKNSDGEYQAVKTLDDGKRVSYSAHVSSIGWQDSVSEGQTAGTTGQKKAIEALKISLVKDIYAGDIEYCAYVAKQGWQDWKKNGELAGTTGIALGMEAVSIRLTGEMAEHYDIYYRVHSQTFGWLGWAKNGEPAGTADYAKSMEAIEIRLVDKSAPAPGSTANAFLRPAGVFYETHVQSYGWTDLKSNGQTSGTIGQAKRLEGIKISLKNLGVSGDVVYRTHVQSYSWMDWVKNGQLSGTTGEAKRLEAIQIYLTGEAAEKYDIYYRVHVQSYGWMKWVKNGESAGTTGQAKRLEAIEIKVVPKGTVVQ